MKKAFKKIYCEKTEYRVLLILFKTSNQSCAFVFSKRVRIQLRWNAQEKIPFSKSENKIS